MVVAERVFAWVLGVGPTGHGVEAGHVGHENQWGRVGRVWGTDIPWVH
jgi:hypothetical protein